NHDYDGELPSSRYFAHQTKAVTIEKSGAHYRMHYVVCKRHPADRCQATGQRIERCRLRREHDCADPTQADQQTRPIIKLNAVEEGIAEVPASGEVTVSPVERHGNTDD